MMIETRGDSVFLLGLDCGRVEIVPYGSTGYAEILVGRPEHAIGARIILRNGPAGFTAEIGSQTTEQSVLDCNIRPGGGPPRGLEIEIYAFHDPVQWAGVNDGVRYSEGSGAEA